jgi:LmbE family N-acetylglucosaminyl deacetylase
MTDGTFDEMRSELAGLKVPGRVLTVGAHPDDAEFGAGATLSRWASAGCEVTILVVTDGSKGSWDVTIDQSELISRRKKEQRAAASVIGAVGVVHLDHVDGELEYTADLRTEIAMEIRRHTPDVVITHDPWQRYQMHPDHRATGLAAVDGVVSAREPLALMQSGLDAHRPGAVLLWSPDEPDHSESVSDEWFDHKLNALLCHSSQGETTMSDAATDAAKRASFTHRLRTWHVEQGERLGVGPAEVFKRLKP